MNIYSFAENLCRICKERHITVEELAERIDKSPRQVNRYRNGQCIDISLGTIIKIADVLGVKAEELLE